MAGGAALAATSSQQSQVKGMFLGDPNRKSPLSSLMKNGKLGIPKYMEDYFRTQIPYAAPGIVCFGILAAAFFPFCCARTCYQKRCCKPKKHLNEYSFIEQITPLALYLIFAIVAVAMSVYGTIQIGFFASGFVDVICQAKSFSTDLTTFTLDVQYPITNIVTQTDAFVATATTKLASNGDLSLLKTDLIQSTKTYGEHVDAVNFTLPNNIKLVCKNAYQEVDAVAKVVVDALVSTGSSIQSGVIDSAAVIKATASTANETVGGSLQFFQGPLDSGVNQASEAILPYRAQMADAGMAVFVLFFISLPLMIAGLMLSKVGKQTNCTGMSCIDNIDDRMGDLFLFLSWVLLFIGCMLMFLFSGLFIPVSRVFGDFCIVMDEIPTDFNAYLGPYMTTSDESQSNSLNPVSLLSGCYDGIPAMQTLNISGSFDFNNTLDFESTTMSADFTFSQIDSCNNLVSSLSMSDLSVGGYETYASSVLTQMKSNVSIMYTNSVDFKAAVKKYQDDMTSIQSDMNPVLNSVNMLGRAGNCTFLKKNYDGFTTTLCSKMLDSLLLSALAMFSKSFQAIFSYFFPLP